MIEMFKYYQPEVFGIQEGLHHQVMYIDSSLSSYGYFGVGRDDGASEGEYCAVYYQKERFSINLRGTFWLSPTPEKVSRGWDAALERICTYGLFTDKHSGKKFWVFNTHFDHRGSLARDQSAELVVEKIRELNSENLPVVLMGDLNATPQEKPITTLNGFLELGYSISSKPLYGPVGTYNGFSSEPSERLIDYIFVKGFTVNAYRHIDDTLPTGLHISDHLPVMLEGAIMGDH